MATRRWNFARAGLAGPDKGAVGAHQELAPAAAQLAEDDGFDWEDLDGAGQSKYLHLAESRDKPKRPRAAPGAEGLRGRAIELAAEDGKRWDRLSPEEKTRYVESADTLERAARRNRQWS